MITKFPADQSLRRGACLIRLRRPGGRVFAPDRTGALWPSNSSASNPNENGFRDGLRYLLVEARRSVRARRERHVEARRTPSVASWWGTRSKWPWPGWPRRSSTSSFWNSFCRTAPGCQHPVLRERAPHVPVIVFGAVDDEAFALEAVHAGAQDYWSRAS